VITVQKFIELVDKIYDGEEELPAILLLGPPGIGKTVSIKTLAKRLANKLGRQFVDLTEPATNIEELERNIDRYFIYVGFSVTHVEPTDISGFPRQVGGYVSYLPLEYVYLLSHPDAAGVVFLDEITTDNRPDRRSAEFKILDERQFGFRTLSKKVLIVAAGNTEEDTSLAEPLPDPILRGRVMIFRIRPPSVEEWIDFMDREYGNRWDRRIGAFLTRYPDSLWVKAENPEGYEPRLSPRTWTKLARILWRLREKDADDEDIEAIVGAFVSGKEYALLMTFLKTVIPELEELLRNPRVWTNLSLEAKYVVTAELSQSDPVMLVEKFYELLNLMAEKDREFLELLKILIPKEKRRAYLEQVKRRMPKVWEVYRLNLNRSRDFGL